VVYKDIVNLLKNKIGSPTYSIGDILPPENELAELYNVSRNTLRKALKVLEDEELIERRHGSGTYIRNKHFQASVTHLDSFTEIARSEGKKPNSQVISVDDEFVELASGKFDAGIRLGESVEQDMVAVRLTKNLRWAVLGSPDYFSRYGYPEKPEDLISHQAIHYRFAGSGQLYEWEFKREGNSVRVAIPGRLTINDRSSLLSMARRGLGLVYVSDIEAAEDLQSGNLKSILLDYIPESSGLYLYFPTRMQTQPKLKAFIEVATRDLRAGYPPFPKAP